MSFKLVLRPFAAGLALTGIALLPDIQDPAPAEPTCFGDGCIPKARAAIPEGLEPRVTVDIDGTAGLCNCDGPDCIELGFLDCKVTLKLQFDLGPNGGVVFDSNQTVVASGTYWEYEESVTGDCDSTDSGGVREDQYYIYVQPVGRGSYQLYDVQMALLCPTCGDLNEWCD